VVGGITETCVIPHHFPGAKYSKKDGKAEAKLCSYDIGQDVAACPKLNSTNPGVNFIIPPAVMNVAEFTAKSGKVKGAKLVAKYKLSTSCSYTPSLLGYYHVSRILGGIGDVPPAVLRTMDLQRHIKIGENALARAKKGSLIYKTWSGLLGALKAGRSSSKADLLLTNDFQQSYGAHQKNPGGERLYKEFFNGGADRVAAFKAKNPIYHALENPSLRVSRGWNASDVQAMVQLKDMSEMILLDTILSQQDRMGNTHYKVKYYYEENKDGKTKVKSAGKKENIPAGAQGSAVAVKQLLLKDNDCGVAKENRFQEAQLLDQVSHLDPHTYRRLLAFDQSLASPETMLFFQDGLDFTRQDYQRMAENVHNAAQMLHAACVSGRLKLDLDLDRYFSGQPLPAKWDCDQ
jgi:hypothetical protein